MAYSVSSWFIDQTVKKATEPDRQFLIGTSDYSDRVVRYPSIKRTTKEIQSVNLNVSLVNVDGELNTFYSDTYSLPNTCQLKFGYTYPDSDTEYIILYTGFIKEVRYLNKNCTIMMRDRLWQFSEKKVGASAATVTMSAQIPSDIAWTLCTCYGELSAVASTSNPDVDYQSFLDWAATFSADSITCEAFYKGMRVTEALRNLATMNASAIWVEGDGLVHFKKFDEADSNDITITRDELMDMRIKVQGLETINKQYVNFDYAVGSDYWQSQVFDVNTTSVNTFGLQEDILEDKSIWFVDSDSAMSLAQRKVNQLSDPPRGFDVDTILIGIHKQLGETVRLVDSFFDITSVTGWRITEYQKNMETGAINFIMDESAGAATGFFLDRSRLDSQDKLL